MLNPVNVLVALGSVADVREKEPELVIKKSELYDSA